MECKLENQILLSEKFRPILRLSQQHACLLRVIESELCLPYRLPVQTRHARKENSGQEVGLFHARRQTDRPCCECANISCSLKTLE